MSHSTGKETLSLSLSPTLTLFLPLFPDSTTSLPRCWGGSLNHPMRPSKTTTMMAAGIIKARRLLLTPAALALAITNSSSPKIASGATAGIATASAGSFWQLRTSSSFGLGGRRDSSSGIGARGQEHDDGAQAGAGGVGDGGGGSRRDLSRRLQLQLQWERKGYRPTTTTTSRQHRQQQQQQQRQRHQQQELASFPLLPQQQQQLFLLLQTPSSSSSTSSSSFLSSRRRQPAAKRGLFQPCPPQPVSSSVRLGQRRWKTTYERFGEPKKRSRSDGGEQEDVDRLGGGAKGDHQRFGFGSGGSGGPRGPGGSGGWRTHPLFLALRRRLGDRGLLIWGVGVVGGGGYYLVQ